MSTIAAQIVAVIADINPAIQVGGDQHETSLFDLGLDSLDHANVLLRVEEEFDCKIPDEQAEKLLSVSALAEFVRAQKG